MADKQNLWKAQTGDLSKAAKNLLLSANFQQE